MTTPTPPRQTALDRGFPPLAAFIIGTIVFFLLRNFRIPGGDTIIVLSNHWYGLLWGFDYVYYAREPWCHSLARFFFHFTNDVTDAYTAYCCVSGGLFLALLAWHCRRPRFWMIMLVSAATWNFVGHVEYYAPEMVTLLLFMITLSRALEPIPRARPVHVALAFGLSYLFHKLTLFFLPATLWLFFTRAGGRWVRRPVPRRQVELSLAIGILAFLADIIPSIVLNLPGFPFNAMYVPVNEGLMDLLTPLTPSIARYFEHKSITGMFYIYTFGTRLHFAYFFGFLLAGAPLGLVFLARRWRRIGESDAAKALATAAVCGLIWTFMWQPRGFWKDWDLFCLAALPVNFLAGSLAVGAWGNAEGGARRVEKEKRGTWRREFWTAAAALAIFFMVVNALASTIQARRIAPGRSALELADLTPLEQIDAPLPLARLEAEWGVKLDPQKTNAVVIYPATGLQQLNPWSRRAVLVALDKKGIILAVKNG